MKTKMCVIVFLFLALLVFSEIIYFSGETPENHYELFMYDTCIDEWSQLTDLRGFISGFDLSEDGKKIYFGLLSTLNNGLYELFLKSGEIKPLLVDKHDNRQPIVMNKTKLVFVSYREKKESLFLLDLNSLEIEPLVILDGYEFSPVISPNKKFLAFVRSEKPYEHDGQIFLYELQTKKMLNLSGDVFGDYSPVFSPDSRKILFSSYREKGQQAIFEMEIDSGKVHKITPIYGTTDRFPVYATNGEWVYFTSLEGQYKIVRMKQDGSQREILDFYSDNLNIGSILVK